MIYIYKIYMHTPYPLTVSRWEEGNGTQSVTLYRDAQHGASVDLGLQTEIMIMPVKTTEQK